MYKKKKNTPLWITLFVVGLLVAGMAAVGYVKKEMEEERLRAWRERSEEIPMHDVLLYKTNAASIEFEKQWLLNDNESESVLRIAEDTLVTLLVTPREGYYLKKADIVDYDFREVNNFLMETTTEAFRVNFVMPDTDIIINFEFAKDPESESIKTEWKETEAVQETAQETELATEENETDTEMPYNLTLHGSTDEVLASFNGQFEETDFLRQLGDALNLNSPVSGYREVTDVAFDPRPYEGDMEPDKVYHMIYLNHNPGWRLLATYYPLEEAYLFTELTEETEKQETEVVTEEQTEELPEDSTLGVEQVYREEATGSYTGSTTVHFQTVTTTTRFDILQVSTTFLKYVGGEEKFYQAAFEYILSSGRTGNIIGTMTSYEIYPDKKRAECKILLNTGESILGSYKKKAKRFTFQGL